MLLLTLCTYRAQHKAEQRCEIFYVLLCLEAKGFNKNTAFLVLAVYFLWVLFVLNLPHAKAKQLHFHCTARDRKLKIQFCQKSRLFVLLFELCQHGRKMTPGTSDGVILSHYFFHSTFFFTDQGRLLFAFPPQESQRRNQL